MTDTFPKFYPIVPDVSWVARLLPLGVEVIQLRIKGEGQDTVRAQVAEARRLCAAQGCQLIVNDYWEAAIELGCSYIHLGQEDLASADLAAIKGAGLKLGLSSHDQDELDAALAARPDYIALGPVYETKLKIMKWAPQGLDRVTQWANAIAPLPLVAIGGITLERAGGVFAAGAASVAVVSDIVTNDKPEARVSDWIRALGGASGDG